MQSLVHTVRAPLWLSSRLAPVSKTGRTRAVYWDTANKVSRIFSGHPGPPATPYQGGVNEALALVSFYKAKHIMMCNRELTELKVNKRHGL